MIITIDTNQWVTPRIVRRRLKISSQTLENWILRGKIASLYIPELEIRLVDNIKKINDLRSKKRNIKK